MTSVVVSRIVPVATIRRPRTPTVVGPFNWDFVFNPLTPNPGQTVAFLVTGRSSNPPANAFSWKFGDGGTATGALPTHVFASAGDFTVTLQVDDTPPGLRDPLTWPFTPDSIWNLPIGASATYVAAGLTTPTTRAFFDDPDIITMTASAPSTAVVENHDDWTQGLTRCDNQGWGTLFSAPFPNSFVVPGIQGTDTPNAASAFLLADGHTLKQHQPFARCTVGGTATSHYLFDSAPFAVEDLYGTGRTGSHGGSGLSALGGTIRLGELVPGGTIPHALKFNIDAVNFSPNVHPQGGAGYRWPAVKSDNGGAGYTGGTPACTMGSLLALKPAFDISTLESAPGKIIAHAAQDYGIYNVDSAGWSVIGCPTERSPSGLVRDEFLGEWGIPLNAGINDNGWARDLVTIFTNLWVVDNWNAANWATVSASAGTLGVGGGAPRVAWAPALA